MMTESANSAEAATIDIIIIASGAFTASITAINTARQMPRDK